MTRITEHVLVSARRGDGDAFAVIWGEMSPAVAGCSSTRGVADPEGVTSDVVLTLLPQLAELTGGSAGWATFVFSVAHARLVDETRHRARQPGQVEFDRRVHGGLPTPPRTKRSSA